MAIECRPLAELSANPGRALTHERLLEQVWGERSGGDVRPLRAIVSRLRRKLGRRFGQVNIYPNRAPRRLQDAQGGDAYRGAVRFSLS